MRSKQVSFGRKPSLDEQKSQPEDAQHDAIMEPLNDYHPQQMCAEATTEPSDPLAQQAQTVAKQPDVRQQPQQVAAGRPPQVSTQKRARTRCANSNNVGALNEQALFKRSVASQRLQEPKKRQTTQPKTPSPHNHQVNPNDPYERIRTLKNEVEDDIVCDVCLDGDDDEDDEILICELCLAAVHQKCYGGDLVDGLPPSDQHWHCDRCKHLLKNPKTHCTELKCELCPDLKGIIKPISDNTWAHITCVQWTPEIWYDDEVRKTTVSRGVSQARYELNCKVCSSKKGSCIQCDFKDCTWSTHVRCAIDTGVIQQWDSMVEGLGKLEDYDLPIFCPKHKDEGALLYKRHGSAGIKGKPVACKSKRTVNLGKARRRGSITKANSAKPNTVKTAAVKAKAGGKHQASGKKSMDIGRKPRVVTSRNARPPTKLQKGPNKPVAQANIATATRNDKPQPQPQAQSSAPGLMTSNGAVSLEEMQKFMSVLQSNPQIASLFQLPGNGAQQQQIAQPVPQPSCNPPTVYPNVPADAFAQKATSKPRTQKSPKKHSVAATPVKAAPHVALSPFSPPSNMQIGAGGVFHHQQMPQSAYLTSAPQLPHNQAVTLPQQTFQ